MRHFGKTCETDLLCPPVEVGRTRRGKFVAAVWGKCNGFGLWGLALVRQAASGLRRRAQGAVLAAGGAGSVKIEAGAAGKVFKIEASVGQAVKKGDAVLVLEIMKMETPVVAPQDGTVASINVNVGDMVEAGALLATLN